MHRGPPVRTITGLTAGGRGSHRRRRDRAVPQDTTGPETTPDGYTTNVSTSQAHFDLVDYTTEKPDENNTLTSE